MERRQLLKLRLIGIMLIALGIGYPLLATRTPWQPAGSEVDAVAEVIDSKEHVDEQGNTLCVLTLRVRQPDGNIVRFTRHVPREVFDQAKTAGQMPVRYDPENPGNVVVGQQEEPFWERHTVWIGVILAICGLAISAYAFRQTPEEVLDSRRPGHISRG
ncbi:MAG: hypothetical protein ACOY3P_09745 [Planctomycetota bacterium]